ncbi:MAG: LysR family transcriptional regulator [Acidobacteriia bacterium]|nr:LysR family transcriptional regulator [Terriglobia bacterium]
MELHQFRYFLAVAQFRSFTRAAEHQHVAQPSLSQQIRKLEAELGAPLFDRLGRKIRLTALGERFQEHAQRVLRDLENARREADEILGVAHGRVAVGVIPTVAPFLLPCALTAFARAYPEITVRVTEDLTQALLHRLGEGEIDLALLSLPVKGAEYVALPLVKDRMLLAVPTHHALCRRRRGHVILREIVHEPFLLLKDGHCFRDDVLQVCKLSRLNPHVAFEGGQFDTLVAMVAAGAGITLLPEMSRAHYRHAGVRLLEFAPPEPTRTIGTVRLKGKYLTRATKAFVEVLKETCPGDGKAKG